MSFPTTITPSALPSLPLDERYDLPDTAAIYFVLADNTVLYIGQSINVRQRWAAHHRLKQLNERDGCRIAWMTVDDAGLLDELERACIAHFQPMLNGSDVLWPVEGNKPVTILFPPEIVTRIRAQAAQQATPFTILLRQWVVQRLEEEEREREQKRGYRSLESGEQAIQKTCPECGDRHVALLDPSTGASECRACGKRFFVNTKPRPEREKWEQKQ